MPKAEWEAAVASLAQSSARAELRDKGERDKSDREGGRGGGGSEGEGGGGEGVSGEALLLALFATLQRSNELHGGEPSASSRSPRSRSCVLLRRRRSVPSPCAQSALPAVCFRVVGDCGDTIICYVESQVTVINDDEGGGSAPDTSVGGCRPNAAELPASKTPFAAGCVSAFDVVVDAAMWSR